MARIILIETSTALTSTAVAQDGKIIASRVSEEPRAQASMTAPYVQEMLDELGIRVSDCDAVCLSMGPGSYTGLRVGSSTAKGLCFGGGIPLLAIGTLDVLVAQAMEGGAIPEGCSCVVPMIDARRMEVYSAIFTPDGKQLTETAPLVVEPGCFDAQLAEGHVLFVGDGAGKCGEVLAHPNATFMQCNPLATAMAHLAEEAFVKGEFKDIAYFEPFYLKQFVATVSSKKLF